VVGNEALPTNPPSQSSSAATWMSLWVSIPPNSTPAGWAVAVEDVMLAMSALLNENGTRVGWRLTKSDGQDRDGLVEAGFPKVTTVW
jgi:hypothetical protein